jgi:hypothetical protein
MALDATLSRWEIMIPRSCPMFLGIQSNKKQERLNEKEIHSSLHFVLSPTHLVTVHQLLSLIRRQLDII